jgi:cell division protein FtsQ
LQQIGTGPDIWRRASQSPAPRPVLEASATLRRPAIRRRATKRGKTRLLLQAVALGLAFGVAAALFGAVQRPLGRSAGVVAEVERWLELMGLGLQQVALSGYRFTPDGDIFDAIDLGAARTLLTFDTRAAQARIERLPWVERASIERVLPDRLEVRIVERTAFAVWSLGARRFLVDKAGRVLGAVPQAASPPLPRISGEDAAVHAAPLFALLANHPAVMRRLEVAEWIGQRRWRLRLAGGGAIELPAVGAAEALARVAAIGEGMQTGAKVIDLRVAGRTLVREASGRLEGAGALDALLESGI